MSCFCKNLIYLQEKCLNFPQGHSVSNIYLLFLSSKWIEKGGRLRWRGRVISQMTRLCSEYWIRASHLIWMPQTLSLGWIQNILKSSSWYLGSISGILTASWSPRGSSWPLSSSLWRPPPCPARGQCPDWGCLCEPRDKSGWCHYHLSSVTLCCILPQ